MQFRQFTLDPFQEQAITAIEQNHSVVVSAPTGSGKTLIADYIIYKHHNDQKRIIYTAPIKALSNQKYKDFSIEYGTDKVGLMTGDIVINPQAKILIMTTEIYRNMVVSEDSDVKDIAYVIFDEIHYINDLERGYVWEESIIYSSPDVRFLCLSATIPNAEEFSHWIKAIKKHPVKTVMATTRNVPLKHLFYDYELGVATLEQIRDAAKIPHYNQVFRKKGRREKITVPEPSHVELVKELGLEKLPCLFFSFSRNDCQVKARELARKNLFQRNSRIIELFNDHLKTAPPDISKLHSTIILRETLPQGIAFHHAGLLPIIKEAIENLFSKALIKILYATETFAVGINMPAKTVCFNSLRKYDGINFRYLNTKEYFQIAGRAGRRGIDELGYVVSLVYRPTFDYQEYQRITSKDIEPIKSQFKLSTNTVLNLINLHSRQEIEKILRLSFYSYQKYGDNYEQVPTKMLLSRYYSITRKLKKFGYINNEQLTEKGIFSSRIFADEITFGEIFATDLQQQLNEHQILLVLGALVYEPRVTHKFKQRFNSHDLASLKSKLRRREYLAQEKKFESLDAITALIDPVCKGESFFHLLELSSLLEGDLIRFLAQISDRLGQIKKATSDHQLLNKIDNCQGIVNRVLEGIYLIG